MKVAIDAFRLVDEPHTSGATYVAELARALAPLPEVDAVRLLVPRPPDGMFQYRKLLSMSGVTFAWPDTPALPARNFRATLSWIQRVIPRLVRETDTAWYVAPYHQAPVGLERSTKVLTVIHDVCGLYPSSGYYWHKKGPYRHLTNFLTALWRSDAFVYVSDHTRSRFGRLFPWATSRPSRVIHNRVSMPSATSGDIVMVLAEHGLEAGSYFLAFASPSPRKGLDLVLSGFRSYVQSGGSGRLVLVAGSGFFEQLTSMVRAHKIAESVTIISGASDSERDALYEGALALVFPSRCEGFGYPVLEAMACGCPPIAWERSPAREIVRGAVPMLERLDENEVALHLRRFEAMPVEERTQLRAALQGRAQDLADSNFGREFLALMESVA